MDEYDPIDRFRLQRCYYCGYDLRGLASGTCPECGTRVAEIIVFPGSSRALLLSLFWTAATVLMIVSGALSGRFSAMDFIAYAVFCGLAASSWFSIPRNGMARDRSGVIITNDGLIRPVMWRYERTPWSCVEKLSLARSRHTPEMRGGTAFYRCDLMITLAEWRKSHGRWLPPWFERLRTTAMRATLTASEHEREFLELEINRMRGRDAQGRST